MRFDDEVHCVSRERCAIVRCQHYHGTVPPLVQAKQPQ
eukprot:COSAG06_NODE_43655_length_370_cov_0.575646_2_plen_37_part_01